MAFLQKITITLSIVCGSFFANATFASIGSQPQKLKSQEFVVCGKKLQLEVADNDRSRSIGLMYRREIPPGSGMIFIFPDEQIRNFWMKNVPFDIDIGYFNSKGHLVKSLTMAGTSPVMQEDRLPFYSSEKPARYAIEVEKGFFAKYDKKNRCRFSPLPSYKK